MLSPASAIAAGAIVFAIGGVLFIAQPFARQDASAPGAATEAPTPVAFTARYSWSHQPATGETETLPNGIERTKDAAWLFRSTSASDKRFEGVSTLNSTWDWYPEAEETGVSLNAHVVRYENDEGAWQSAPFTRFEWYAGDTPGDVLMQTGESTQYTLHGEDAYEGLIALVVETWNGNGWDLEGYIFDGDLPPAPEGWSESSESQ
jgi:hypothetical protein